MCEKYTSRLTRNQTGDFLVCRTTISPSIRQATSGRARIGFYEQVQADSNSLLSSISLLHIFILNKITYTHIHKQYVCMSLFKLLYYKQIIIVSLLSQISDINYFMDNLVTKMKNQSLQIGQSLFILKRFVLRPTIEVSNHGQC